MDFNIDYGKRGEPINGFSFSYNNFLAIYGRDFYRRAVEDGFRPEEVDKAIVAAGVELYSVEGRARVIIALSEMENQRDQKGDDEYLEDSYCPREFVGVNVDFSDFQAGGGGAFEDMYNSKIERVSLGHIVEFDVIFGEPEERESEMVFVLDNLKNPNLGGVDRSVVGFNCMACLFNQYTVKGMVIDMVIESIEDLPPRSISIYRSHGSGGTPRRVLDEEAPSFIQLGRSVDFVAQYHFSKEPIFSQCRESEEQAELKIRINSADQDPAGMYRAYIQAYYVVEWSNPTGIFLNGRSVFDDFRFTRFDPFLGVNENVHFIGEFLLKFSVPVRRGSISGYCSDRVKVSRSFSESDVVESDLAIFRKDYKLMTYEEARIRYRQLARVYHETDFEYSFRFSRAKTLREVSLAFRNGIIYRSRNLFCAKLNSI